MMACVADKIISAPFAVIGSIGVVAAIPNFHKILRKMTSTMNFILQANLKELSLLLVKRQKKVEKNLKRT